MCHAVASEGAFHDPASARRRCDGAAAEVTVPADSSEGLLLTEVCPTSCNYRIRKLRAVEQTAAVSRPKWTSKCHASRE